VFNLETLLVRRRLIPICCALIAVGGLIPFGTLVAQEPPTKGYVSVPEFVPVKPGEHPRLLFRKSDLPEIRRRAQTPEGRKLVERLKATLGGGDKLPGPDMRNPSGAAYNMTVSLPEGAYSISHAAGYGMLYQLTGDQKYAALARQAIELGLKGVRDRDPQARYAMIHGGGALRQGPSMGWTAVAYDLCYDGWTPEFRQKVADYLMGYDSKQYEPLEKQRNGKLSHVTLKGMADKPSHGPGSNHYGSITGGAGLVLLAVKGDPEARKYAGQIETYLPRNEKEAVRALQGFGPRGFFFEGQGPSHMGAYPAMLSYFRALRNVTGRDYMTPNERMHWITLRWMGEVTVDRNGLPVYLARHEAMGQQYGSDVLKTSGGLSDNGRFSLGFASLPEKYHPYALWAFERYFQKADAGRFDTLNYPHLAISALVSWPIGVQPKNPQGSFPTAYRDQEYGHYVFRNGWSGTPDEVLVTAFTGIRGGTRQKPWKALPLKIRAFGTKHEIDLGWKVQKIKEAGYHHDASRNSTSVAFEDGGILAVDFSRRSGAAAVIVLKNGPQTRGGFYSGYSPEFMHHTQNGLHILTVNKTEMHPKVLPAGSGVQVGGMLIQVEGDQIRFSTAEKDAGKLNSYTARGIDPKIDAVTPETTVHPGKPDALMAFDYADYEQKDGTAYFRQTIGGEELAMAYNLRPEHLRPGVFGQAFPFRPTGKVPSSIPGVSEDADADVLHELGFNGIMGAVHLPGDGSWDLGGGDFTISFWLKLNEARSGYALLVEPRGGSGFHMGFHPGPTLMMAGQFGGLNVPFPNEPGEWHLVSMVYDTKRKVVSYYVDNQMAGRAKAGGKKSALTGEMILGGRLAGGARFPKARLEGDMDEFALYRRALTAGEINALFQAGQSGEKGLSGRSKSSSGIAANLDVDKIVGSSPLSLNFSAGRSMSPGGKASWDFGDGSSAQGLTAKHTYTKDGTYDVILTLTDAKGNRTVARQEIRVFNRPPVAVINQVSRNGRAVHLSAGSSTDPDGGPLQFAWVAAGTTYRGPELKLEALPPGSHEIVLAVQDVKGAVRKTRHTVSVLDAQGYRLGENPENLVPGLHYQVQKLFREPKDVWMPSHPEVDKHTSFLDHGVVNDLSFSAVTSAGSGRYVLMSGYLEIPKDGEYKVALDGMRNLKVYIGNDFSLKHGSRFGNMRPASVETIKLRKGLHRILFMQPGFMLSKNTPFSLFFGRVMLTHPDGTHLVVGGENTFRSRITPEDTGSDVASLQNPELGATPMAAGNRPPQVQIVSEVVGEMKGAQTIRFVAKTSDPDGDSLTLRWALPDSQNVTDKNAVMQVLTAGTYTVDLEADDGRGGKSRVSKIIQVEGQKARSVSIDFMYESAASGGTFPGERVGLVPSSLWNHINASISRRAKTNQVPNRYGPQPEKHGQPLQQLWVDSEGNTFPMKVTFPKKLRGYNHKELPWNVRKSPVHRLMRNGISTEEMVVEGLPFERYDVIIYLAGRLHLPSPPHSWWLQDGKPDTGKKKKRAPQYGEPMLRANQQQATFTANTQHTRWNGVLSEVSPQNPNGNVIVLRGVSGKTCRLTLTGTAVAGLQFVERP